MSSQRVTLLPPPINWKIDLEQIDGSEIELTYQRTRILAVCTSEDQCGILGHSEEDQESRRVLVS